MVLPTNIYQVGNLPSIWILLVKLDCLKNMFSVLREACDKYRDLDFYFSRGLLKCEFLSTQMQNKVAKSVNIVNLSYFTSN